MSDDEQYLKLLSIFHYVVGGLTGLFACIPLIHFSIGIAILVGGIDDVPAFVGLILVMIALAAMTMGWALAICIIIAGGRLARRQRYTYCLVVAAVSCIFMPFGTVLGVLTIIVLMRQSVKELFGIHKEV